MITILDLIVRDGRRQSIFRAYTFPYMARPNLTVLSDLKKFGRELARDFATRAPL